MVIISSINTRVLTMKFQTIKIESFINKIQLSNIDPTSIKLKASDKAYLIQNYVQSEFYKELFNAKLTYSSNVLDPKLNTKGLEVGQIVTYTNEFGISFLNSEILGFNNDTQYGQCVYLNNSSYWFPVSVESLTIQDGLIGLTQEDLDSITDQYRENFIPWDLKIIRENTVS